MRRLVVIAACVIGSFGIAVLVLYDLLRVESIEWDVLLMHGVHAGAFAVIAKNSVYGNA
jgi:hypothetical protein